MTWLLLLFALLVGVALPFQAGVNAQLKLWLGHPVIAALASFTIGTLFLLAYTLALGLPAPAWSTLPQVPWWQWLGGVLGAFYIAATVVLAPRLGAAALIAALVAGQMVASLLLDHFGLVGYKVHPMNLWRLLGVGLLIAGVLLIQRN
jgi:transporter family-2 protein